MKQISINKPDFIAKAQAVLRKNDQGSYICPSKTLYPHHWLWDTCFIAIGIRHYDPQRAANELLTLFAGQWKNGMLPHIIFNKHAKYWVGPEYWQAHTALYSPNELDTSGITQPPLPAYACKLVADKLTDKTADDFLRRVYPVLLSYHTWLYTERNPQMNCLAVLIHPWETGMDNTPPWMQLLKKVPIPLWLRLALIFKLDWLLKFFRRDTKIVPQDERMSTIEALRSFNLILEYRKLSYDGTRILAKPDFAIESLTFNAILIRSNEALCQIAKQLGQEVPSYLYRMFEQTKTALELLWDNNDKRYYPRNYATKKLLKQDSISTILPLFSGSITRERAAELVKLLKNEQLFWPRFPVPTVPLKSSFFNPRRYWQGPTWVNMNWLIIKGLLQYGYLKEAKELHQETLVLLSRTGFYEYFSPKKGTGYGVDSFSWSAALAIDMISDDFWQEY